MRLEIVREDNGPGLSVYINDQRIAGPKPWGGGTILRAWVVDTEEIQRIINEERAKRVLAAISDVGEDDRD